jgi:hypothetical protein
VFKTARRASAEPAPTGLVGDHADKLSRIRPIAHYEEESSGREVPPPPAAPRIKARWFFLAALMLAVLAFFILPTPLSGFSALLCVGAFITGGARLIQAGDPEMSKKVTQGGFIGGGGF